MLAGAGIAGHKALFGRAVPADVLEAVFARYSRESWLEIAARLGAFMRWSGGPGFLRTLPRIEPFILTETQRRRLHRLRTRKPDLRSPITPLAPGVPIALAKAGLLFGDTDGSRHVSADGKSTDLGVAILAVVDRLPSPVDFTSRLNRARMASMFIAADRLHAPHGGPGHSILIRYHQLVGEVGSASLDDEYLVATGRPWILDAGLALLVYERLGIAVDSTDGPFGVALDASALDSLVAGNHSAEGWFADYGASIDDMATCLAEQTECDLDAVAFCAEVAPLRHRPLVQVPDTDWFAPDPAAVIEAATWGLRQRLPAQLVGDRLGPSLERYAVENLSRSVRSEGAVVPWTATSPEGTAVEVADHVVSSRRLLAPMQIKAKRSSWSVGPETPNLFKRSFVDAVAQHAKHLQRFRDGLYDPPVASEPWARVQRIVPVVISMDDVPFGYWVLRELNEYAKERYAVFRESRVSHIELWDIRTVEALGRLSLRGKELVDVLVARVEAKPAEAECSMLDYLSRRRLRVQERDDPVWRGAHRAFLAQVRDHFEPGFAQDLLDCLELQQVTGVSPD